MSHNKDNLVITKDDPFGPDGALLIHELDRHLNGLYPTSSVHGLHPDDSESGRFLFLIARQNGNMLGCGGLRVLDDHLVEIKRMYIRPAFRRQGIAYRILVALENAAADMNAKSIRLETGFRQVEAVAFYEKYGYIPITCYGEYEFDPHSLCYEKKLSVDDPCS